MDCKNLFEALIKFKSEAPDISKDKIGQKGNLKFGYAPLDHTQRIINPILCKHGLSVIQPIVTIDGVEYVRTLLFHVSGEFIESLMQLPHVNNDQEAGKTLKYKRRNAYESILGLCPGEDDSDDRPTEYEGTYRSKSAPVGKPTQQVVSKPRPVSPASEEHQKAVLMGESNNQLKRLNWTAAQGQSYLMTTFNKHSRQLLSAKELSAFVDHLKSLPDPKHDFPPLEKPQPTRDFVPENQTGMLSYAETLES